MFIVLLISISISTVLIMINSLIAKKMIFDREKPSPFECGFDSKSTARIPFSLRFYLIALVFLIFDVEITLIIPMPLISESSSNIFLTAIFSFFIMILIVGLFHEWNESALEWDL